jgi:hypothetical protein
MKNTVSNNKSRFLSILVTLSAILSPIAVHADIDFLDLFASVNGNTQNFGGGFFQIYAVRNADHVRSESLSPTGLAKHRADLYVATKTLDPVTGNLSR